MPTQYKVLGQLAPAAVTTTTLYTVPAGRSTVSSTIVVANRANTAATFKIWVRVAGEAIADKQVIAPDVVVGGNDSTTLTIGVTLGATDVISVQGSTANLSFNMFGSEIY